jgi:hypothetical protein
MEAVLLLAGLTGVGYVLSNNDNKAEGFQSSQVLSPSETPLEGGTMRHNNMVPYYSGSRTQSVHAEANTSRLDAYIGKGDTMMEKREVAHMGMVAPDVGNPYGMPVRTDFEQSRIEAPIRAANVTPFERVNVGPGLGQGYKSEGYGGRHQFEAQQYMRPKTTDELRVATNPKVSYKTDPVPGVHYVHNNMTAPEQHPGVPRNRPDTFYLSGPERWFTAVGVEKGMTARADVILKDQNRESTDVTATHWGPAQAAAAGYQSYLRPLASAFRQFFKLTVGEHFGVPTTGGIAFGPALYDVWNTMKINFSREELEGKAARMPNGAGDFQIAHKEERGASYIRKNEEDYTWTRVTNPARHNLQASSHDAMGSHHVKDRVGGDVMQQRLGVETKAAGTQLNQNPYHVTPKF